MNNDEQYLVPAREAEITLVEKRSRFIARVWPVVDEAAAQLLLDETRRRHHDANHNVYAFIIRHGPTRCSDDGEPQGTAGLPVLKVLEGRRLNNVVCVVTRYFGGVLSLVRAYATAARSAVDAAGILTMRLWRVMLVPCPYPLIEQVKLAIEQHGGVVASADYGTDILIEAMLPDRDADAFLAHLGEVSAGRVEAETLDRIFRGA